jgi:hypothetical protein
VNSDGSVGSGSAALELTRRSVNASDWIKERIGRCMRGSNDVIRPVEP